MHNLVKLFRLCVYYWTSLEVEKSQLVGCNEVIQHLRYSALLISPPQTSIADYHTDDIAKIILEFTELHTATLFGVQKDISKVDILETPICTWGSLMAARYCFLYGVLGFEEINAPILTRLPAHLFTLLLHEADANISALLLAHCNPDFYLWKVFSAMVALLRFWDDLIELENPQDIQRLRLSGESLIEHWRWVQGVENWHQAECALKQIVWPESTVEEALQIWETLDGPRMGMEHLSLGSMEDFATVE